MRNGDPAALVVFARGIIFMDASLSDCQALDVEMPEFNSAEKPRRILVTMAATLGARYSTGGCHLGADCVTIFTRLRTIAGSAPLSTLEPHSTVSGRSVTSRRVTLGTPKIHASSCTVPLSESRQNADLSRRTKSKNPNGSTNFKPARSRLMPKFST